MVTSQNPQVQITASCEKDKYEQGYTRVSRARRSARCSIQRLLQGTENHLGAL